MSDEDEFLDDDEIIIENAAECPACHELVEHHILKEKTVGDGVDMLVRCSSCSNIHTLEFRQPPAKQLPCILTEGPQSQKIVLTVDADEFFSKGDVFEEQDKLWEINQLETPAGEHPTTSLALELARIQAIRVDMVRVKLTLTRGEKSRSTVMIVPQETSFTASKMVEFEGKDWIIRAIHTGAGRTMRGTVQAPEIKRMYLHQPLEEKSTQPKTPRERRQAWKEGKLGYNPNPIQPKHDLPKRTKPSGRRTKKSRK